LREITVFEFLKKKRNEAAKRKVMQIGSESVERINLELSNWRATSLEMRRTMMEDLFAERLVEIQAEDGLTWEECAEIEAFAAMKNWYEAMANSAIPESEGFISQEDREIMGVIGIESEIDHHLNKHIEEVSSVFENNINELIVDGISRKGGEATPRN
jgi:hypothetical protein